MGCPNQCVFCDQHAITGAHSFCMESVKDEIEAVLRTKGDRECEIAFFGGSFTGIDRQLMLSLLDVAQEYVNAGKVRGIRMSTRPDYISPEICEILHRYTVSQVELGIQSFDDGVLERCRRGHTAQCAYDAVRLLRREGFSFVGQMMVGLPGADARSEIETAKTICAEGAQGARIYPCVVFRNTPLEEMTHRGEYVPLSVEEAVSRGAAVLRVFVDAGVPVLKIGLHEGEGLHSDKTYFAGPNHPALGELVRSRLYRDAVLAALDARSDSARGKTLAVYVPRGAVSAVSGHKKSNKAVFEEKSGAKCVKILEKDELCGYNVSIDIF